jgi:hypothetical protein
VLIDKTHRRWFLLSAGVLLVATAAYVREAARAPHGPSGGSVSGLTFGIVGTGLMLFAGLLAARKQVPTWRIGSAQFWLRGHIWLGLLSFPFVLFHGGFGWGGTLENWLWIAYAIVMLSGLFGLAMQQFLPRLLTTRVPRETFAAQIDYLCCSMQFLSDKLVAEQCGKLDVDCEELKPFAQAVARKKKWLQRESDFLKLLQAIYVNVAESKPESPTVPHGGAAEPSESSPDDGPAKTAAASVAKSPLAARAAAPASSDANAAADGPTKKSQLELVRARLAATQPSAEPADAASRPASPLELARAHAGNDGSAAVSTIAPPAPAVARTTNPPALAVKTAAAETNPDSPRPALTAVKPVPAAKPSPAIKPAAAKPTSKPVLRTSDLKQFYLRTVRPFLAPGSRPRGPLASPADSDRLFAQVRSDVPVELHAVLQQLADSCEDRRQFHTQQRIQRWLHAWLLIHVPSSVALLVLLAAHAIVALRVVPWGF